MVERKENFFVSITLNILLPVLVLVRFSGDGALGPTLGLVTALAFPIGYGIYDFTRTREVNLWSGIGVLSVVLTGSIGLLRLDPGLVAIKEAGVPFAIGVAVLVSLKTPWPIVKKLVGKVIDERSVYRALERKKSVRAFESRLVKTTYLFAMSFFVSAALNYALAKAIVVSPAGTIEFNEQIGLMTALSFPVIALPMFVILMFVFWYLVRGITKDTGLKLEKIFRKIG